MMKFLGAASAAFALAGMAGATQASTINWTSWSSNTTGTMGAVGVAYSGELDGLTSNYPSWQPSSTFSGGTVGNTPPQAGGIVRLYGGNADLSNTITFSTPVKDPVMAIWSLGNGGTPASFVFTASEPFVIESGGPSNEYGGSTITQSGSTVWGAEGNGTIQFQGVFSSISWRNPQYEYWYGFTVGAPTGGVPEPATWGILLFGLFGLGSMLRRRRAAPAATA